MPAQANSPFPFLDYLNEDPQLAYYSRLYGGGEKLSPNQKGYFGANFNDIYSGYLGTQGAGLEEAQKKGQTLAEYLNDPQTSFLDYLGQQSFGQRFGALPPSMRPGGSTQRYAPSTQWVR